MKASWNHADYALMRSQPLRFAPEDLDLIRLGMIRPGSVLGAAGVSDLARQPRPSEFPVAHNALRR
jgi:hypothetical protein